MRMYQFVAVGVLLANLAAPAMSMPFSNGSFELLQGPQPASNEFLTLDHGSNRITGWVTFGDPGNIRRPIDYVMSGFWLASDGQRSLDLNGESAGGVRQQFDTTPGRQYRVLFDMAANPEGGPPERQLRVTAGDDNADYTYVVTNFDWNRESNPDMRWETKEFVFTADSAETELTFESLVGFYYSPDVFGPALDNVRVELVSDHVVPEPGTLAMMIPIAIAFCTVRFMRPSPPRCDGNEQNE